MKKYFIPLLIILASCRAMLPVPDANDAERAKQRWSNYDFALLEKSHHLYVNKCGGCHTLYLPTHFTEPKWNSVMDTMAVEAKLKPDEKQMILNYLVLMSEKPVVKK
ncbi:MAG: hypothetical protein ACHQNT_10475 [Bacteroidia bacterium]